MQYNYSVSFRLNTCFMFKIVLDINKIRKVLRVNIFVERGERSMER